MNRKHEMEMFIYKLKKLYLENPNLQINSNTFYSSLESYGLTFEEMAEQNMFETNQDILKMFSLWQQDFQNNSKLDVYHTSRQKRFLQFNNCNESESYKLYLNIKKESMYEVVKDIFDFIANNNIKNASKVADCLRSDSIVLRIVNKSDAIKVINYINSNPKIYENARKTNPFVPRYGVVGYAYDKHLSYNSVLCHYFEKYFIEKRNSNTIGLASLSDFNNYMTIIYNNIVNGKINKDSYINNEIMRITRYGMSEEDAIANFKNVIELITCNLHDSLSIYDYFDRVEGYKSKNHMRMLFDNACSIMIDKYGEYHLKCALEFGINGIFNRFTRDNNCRNTMEKIIDRDSFLMYANNELEKLHVSSISR